MSLTYPSQIRLWFGGSFDPVHLGHLAIISHLAKQLQPFANHQTNIHISFLPTAISPLKNTQTHGQYRLDMLRLGIEKYPQYHHLSIGIDDHEIYQTPPIYTFNTFCHFQQLYPNDKLIFVLGLDSLLQLHRWYRGNELLDLTSFWVFPRQVINHVNNQPYLLKNHLKLSDFLMSKRHEIYMDNFIVPNLASRQIRQWLSQNTPSANHAAKQALLADVWDYIQQHQLYLG